MEAGANELFKSLFCWYNKNMLCQHSEHYENWLPPTMTKLSICLILVVLYQNWPLFTHTNLPMQFSIQSRNEMKTFWKKFDKLLLLVHLSFLHEKQLLMILRTENQKIYSNRLLGLALANQTPTRCVNPCQLVFIRVDISIQRRVDLRLEKTRPAALRIWSCPIFNEKDWNVKVKASLKQADRQKKAVLVLMGSVRNATLCLKQWVASTTSVPVKKDVPYSVKTILITVARRAKDRCLETTLYTGEKLQCNWMVGVGMVDTLRNNQNCQTTYQRPLSLQAFTWSWATLRRSKEWKVIWLRAVRYWSTWLFKIKVW